MVDETEAVKAGVIHPRSPGPCSGRARSYSRQGCRTGSGWARGPLPCLGAAGGQLDGCVCSTFPGHPCWLGLLQRGAVGGCRQCRQCGVGCSMGWGSPTALGSHCWDPSGCAQGWPGRQHRQLKSWGAFPGHCRGVGRAAGAPLAAEAAGLGQSIHPELQSPAGHGAGSQGWGTGAC